MPRCSNCGLRIEDPATLCGSCAHSLKRAGQRAARDAALRSVAPPKPPDRPDVDALNERLRLVKEALLEGEGSPAALPEEPVDVVIGDLVSRGVPAAGWPGDVVGGRP